MKTSGERDDARIVPYEYACVGAVARQPPVTFGDSGWSFASELAEVFDETVGDFLHLGPEGGRGGVVDGDGIHAGFDAGSDGDEVVVDEDAFGHGNAKTLGGQLVDDCFILAVAEVLDGPDVVKDLRLLFL